MADDAQGFDWHTLIGPAAGIGAGLAGRALLPSPQQATQAQIPPELRQLLTMGMQRAQYQNPLFQAVSNQAFQGLPTYARQGLAMPNALPQMPSADPSQGGGMPDWLKYLLAAGAGSQARSMLPGGGSGSGGDIGKLIKGIAGLFNHGNFGQGSPWGGLPSYDPAAANPNTGMPYDPMGPAADPSGGSGQGPGMQHFYNSGGFSDPFGPGYYFAPETFNGMPSDPSGGSGIGPGMQAFYGGGGNGGGGNPWDE